MGYEAAELIRRRFGHVRVQALTFAPPIHLCNCVARDLCGPVSVKRVEPGTISGAEMVPERQRCGITVRNNKAHAADDIPGRPRDEYGVNGVRVVLIAFPLALLEGRILELMLNAVHLISQRVCGVQQLRRVCRNHNEMAIVQGGKVSSRR